MQHKIKKIFLLSVLGVAIVTPKGSAKAQLMGSQAGTQLSSPQTGTTTMSQYWGQETGATPQGGCDPAVQTAVDNNNRTMMNNYTQMATGVYPALATNQGFSQLSCLQSLLGSGINGIFSPSSLSAILSAIISEVCAFAESSVIQAEQPLNQAMYPTMAMGQIVPGVNLGSMIGGVSVNPMMGAGSGGLLNITAPNSLTTGSMATTRVGSGNFSNYWGGGQTPASAPAYGNLFGTNGGFGSSGGSFIQQPSTQGGGSWFGGSIFGN